MGELDFQEKVINGFVRILENSLAKWAKIGSLPPSLYDGLSRAANLLIKNSYNPRKVNELMGFIARNANKPLSEKMEKEIIRLKREIENTN